MTHIPHWQFVENVVAAIEAFANGKVADLTITPKAMIPMRHHPQVLREVDVLVTFRVGSRTFRVGVDVKAEKEPVDLVLLEGLWAKAEHLDLNQYTVVSLSGFTKNARLVYGDKGVELVTLEQVASFEWAGLTHFTEVRRTVAFESMEFDYGSPDAGPPEEVVQRNRGWTVMLQGAERPVSWPDYLAENVGRLITLPPGEQPKDSAEPFAVCLLMGDEARKVVDVRDGTERVELPQRVVVTGRFRREERHHPLEKFRSESGEEVMSTVFDLPGWSGGLHQVSIGRSPDEGVGRALVLRVVPAIPKRTPVE